MVSDYKATAYSALLGIIKINGSKHILMCDECSLSGIIGEAPIFEVALLVFLPYEHEKDLAKKPESKEIYRTMRDISLLLKKGFYFSHFYELTRSLSKQ